MTDHQGHLRLVVDGFLEHAWHRASGDLGVPDTPGPEVRPLPQTADDRSAGVHRFETTVDGWVFVVAVEDEPRALLRARAGQGTEAQRHQGVAVVTAQIPGRVVRLWVAEGDTVQAGQRLLAIEAMKMENEVRAPRAGTVESIRVAAGSSVELRDELLTVR
jgi:biotin carboxyl carrier protein